MSIRGVVFDLDGTLTHYSIDLASLRSELISKIREIGLPINIVSFRDYPISMVRKVMVYMENEGYPRSQIKSIASALFKVIEKYELIAANTTTLIPGAIDALRYVHSLNLKCSLYTLCGRRPTMRILERFNLTRYFDAIVTRDDVEHFKPHPEHLLKAIVALELKPSQVVVIGDSVIDVDCAKAVGSISIAVLSGVRTLNELRSRGADYIISSVAELPKILGKIVQCQVSAE